MSFVLGWVVVCLLLGFRYVVFCCLGLNGVLMCVRIVLGCDRILFGFVGLCGLGFFVC